MGEIPIGANGMATVAIDAHMPFHDKCNKLPTLNSPPRPQREAREEKVGRCVHKSHQGDSAFSLRSC